MEIGQRYQDVPSPAELGARFGASFEMPRTPPTITLDGHELRIYEMTSVTVAARRGGNLRLTVGPPVEYLQHAPPCARLTITFEAYDEDGGEYDEGHMPAKAGYYVATVDEVDPDFVPTKP